MPKKTDARMPRDKIQWTEIDTHGSPFAKKSAKERSFSFELERFSFLFHFAAESQNESIN
jgi:hypothetical protein